MKPRATGRLVGGPVLALLVSIGAAGLVAVACSKPPCTPVPCNIYDRCTSWLTTCGGPDEGQCVPQGPTANCDCHRGEPCAPSQDECRVGRRVFCHVSGCAPAEAAPDGTLCAGGTNVCTGGYCGCRTIGAACATASPSLCARLDSGRLGCVAPCSPTEVGATCGFGFYPPWRACAPAFDDSGGYLFMGCQDAIDGGVQGVGCAGFPCAAGFTCVTKDAVPRCRAWCTAAGGCAAAIDGGPALTCQDFIDGGPLGTCAP